MVSDNFGFSGASWLRCDLSAAQIASLAAYHRQGFTYDKLGNRLTLSEPRDDATTTYTYDNVTNELATILDGLYNVRMLVSSDSSYSPIQEQTFYDAYGRADISGSLQ